MSEQEKSPKCMEIYSIREYRVGNEMKKRWFKIGIGFENRNGTWKLRLEANPLPNRESGLIDLYMRPPWPKAEEGEGVSDSGGSNFEPQSFEY